MKKLSILLSLCFFVLVSKAQDENSVGFKKSNLFTGGNVTASFYTGGTVLGVSPHLGYSLTPWLDAAASLNFIYTGQTDIYNNKLRQTNLGPGAFVRLFPINFLFTQFQYEHNFQNIKVIQSGSSSYKLKDDVNSLLIGAGYSSSRQKGSNSYYYLSVMFDALQLPGSPYVDNYGRLIPVIRAGFNIALFR